jgi:hypothetical protein
MKSLEDKNYLDKLATAIASNPDNFASKAISI